MKDLLIKRRTIIRELWILLGCYLIANIVNICAIVSYSTPWKETITMQGYIVVFSLAIYLIIGFIRLIISPLIRKKKKK